MGRKCIKIVVIIWALVLMIPVLATEELTLVPMPREVTFLGWKTSLSFASSSILPPDSQRYEEKRT